MAHMKEKIEAGNEAVFWQGGKRAAIGQGRQ
jgi:hypothetical protein